MHIWGGLTNEDIRLHGSVGKANYATMLSCLQDWTQTIKDWKGKTESNFNCFSVDDLCNIQLDTCRETFWTSLIVPYQWSIEN